MRHAFFAQLLLGATLLSGCSGDPGQTNLDGAPLSPVPVVVPSLETRGALIYSSGGSLIRIDHDGGNARVLTSGFQDSKPFFHPLGLNVLFCRRVAGAKQDIYVMAPDGSGAANLTANLPGDSDSPAYAWDGSFILFSNGADLYIMNPDGTNRRPLTTGNHLDTHPAVSPDHRSVVFERATGDGHSKICKVTLADGQVVDLTSGEFLDLMPSYCPPGDAIVFSRDGALLVMPDTSEPSNLTHLVQDESLATFPRHSLGHDAIFFLTGEDDEVQGRGDEGTDVAVTSLDGHRVRHLTHGAQAEDLAVGPPPAPPTTELPAAIPDQVTVELVNDSEVSDSDVYVHLDTPFKDGQSVEGPPTLQTDSGKTSGTGVKLTTLKQASQKVRSRYSGRVLPVYTFKVNNLESGHVSLSYFKPLVITNGSAPTATADYRFEKVELTYLSKGGTSGGNLTSIDFFGIPVEVNVTHPGQSRFDPLQTKSFYASTPTLLKTLNALGPNMTKAFRDRTGANFPVNGDLKNFTRILSPNTLAASVGSGGSPAPYPGMKSYLQSLVGKTFTLNGTQYGGYDYKATFASDGAGGFVINCTGTTKTTPPGGMPANANVQVKLPKDKMDFFIYACVANKDSYAVAGYPFNNDQGRVNTANASPYGALVGDLQAALNFGYCDGRFGPLLSNFYASVVLPYAYPFGGARKTNDGFYNPYAGLFYYLSDSYGHPYSDRLSAASPLYKLEKGDTLTITLLADKRLDTPLPVLKGRTNNTLRFGWQAVPGAKRYQVTLNQPGKVSITGTECTITELKPGTSYLVSVTAFDEVGQSGVLPTQGVTTGARTPLSGGPITFQANCNLPIKGLTVEINGTTVDPTHNATIAGQVGQNSFGLRILAPNKDVLYVGNYLVTTRAASPTTFTIGPFELEYNLTPLTQAGPPGTPPYPNNAAQLTLGTPFNPKPYYQYFETKFSK